MLSPLAIVFWMSVRPRQDDVAAARLVLRLRGAGRPVACRPSSSSTRGGRIAQIFFVSAATFGALRLYGYTTKRDLSAMGSFLMMGLFGLIIASLVNIFLRLGACSSSSRRRRADLRGPHRL